MLGVGVEDRIPQDMLTFYVDIIFHRSQSFVEVLIRNEIVIGWCNSEAEAFKLQFQVSNTKLCEIILLKIKKYIM